MRIVSVMKAFLQYFTMVFGIILAVMLIYCFENSENRFASFRGNGMSAVESSASFENANGNSNDTDNGENLNQANQSILIPHCSDITYSISEKVSDFSFHNPQKNDCLLRITVTRRDTSEAIYISPLLSPGSKVENVAFFTPITTEQSFEAMVKIDAYKDEFGISPLVNSMAVTVTVTAQP